MHVLGRVKTVIGAAALLCALLPSVALAKPAPGYQPRGFRLFASSSFRWVGNRTQCFLSSTGQVCTAESSVVGGGYWPAGTNNQYIFNTGLQVAGVVDSQSVGNSWAGDITGAFFFNARGGGDGQPLTDIYNSANSADLAGWPTEAYVPSAGDNDQAASLYDVALQGSKTASDNDVWFLSWEGDPSFASDRRHPLGLMVEIRGLAYNTPGKNDFLFFIYTFYNVTAAGTSHVYDNLPSRIASRVRAAGTKFQSLNTAAGATLPADGYTIKNMFLALGADNDVTFEESGQNYDGVNVPFSLGYTYHKSFFAPASWTFDPTIYQPPFFPGAGFIGIKYLRSPLVNGQEVGLSLFGATTNQGQFSDPANTDALYRYLTGNVDATKGDDLCNVGDVHLTHICFINQAAPADMRFFQSSGPLTLAAGEYSSVAAAYIFAPPVASGACTGPGVCSEVRPQSPTNSLTVMLSPDSITAHGGVNTVDTITGFRGYIGDHSKAGAQPDGQFNTYDLATVPGSLLGKAQTAQAVFDTKFVQPAPPKAPSFYLIPGDGQVTVLWQPSPTETDGDPYYSAAQSPANYDPNYRQYDVAGYRVYRGVRGDATSLQLQAQFDKAGDFMTDHTGQINQLDGQSFSDCVPDLGVYISCTAAGQVNGYNLIQPIDVSLDGPLTQWQAVIPSGTRGYATRVDTAVTGSVAGRPSGKPALSGTGIPFVYIDKAVSNLRTYFYMVTAFDINSIRSGPSSLESNLSGARSIVPTRNPSNQLSSASVSAVQVLGENGPLVDNTPPSIDPTTGAFSKKFQPANGASMGFVGQFVGSIFAAPGSVSAKLTDLTLGDARNGVPATYTFQVTASDGSQASITLPIQQDLSGADATATSSPAPFAIPDPGLLAKYHIPSTGISIAGVLSASIPSYQPAIGWGRGCADGSIVPADPNDACLYNGPRWFDTPAEPANPAASNKGTLGTSANFNNAGTLAGVTTVFTPHTLLNLDAGWRRVEAALGGAVRAADFQLTWGTGKIAGIRDLTHDVAVPLQTDRLGGGWGVLNQPATTGAGSFDARPGQLTVADFGCIEPFLSGAVPGPGGTIPCTAATPYALSDNVIPGPIAINTGAATGTQTAPAQANNGFGLYLAGHIFLFELTGGAVPAAGTVWTLRSYTGTVFGGNGAAGNLGNYSFVPATRPFTALGAKLQISYTAENRLVAATTSDLKGVHTVPDPYYVTNTLETSGDNKIIKFVNLPDKAIIRIYSSSGVLVRVLEHSNPASDQEIWDVRNRNGQFVASGVYFWHVEALNARRVGRMTVVNFAR
jgi:hypothetical protein